MGLRTICPIVLLTRWPTDGRGLFVARGPRHPTHSARCCPGTLTCRAGPDACCLALISAKVGGLLYRLSLYRRTGDQMARVMARPGVLRAAASIARNGAARTVHNVRTTGPCLFRSVCIRCVYLRAMAESRFFLIRASGVDGLTASSFLSNID